MNDIGDFLVGLAKLDVKLTLDEDELRCSAPKGVLTPDLVKQLKEHKPTIIAYLAEINSIRRKQNNPILPVERNKPLAASHAQNRLWFIEQMGIQDSTYMIRNALHLKGQPSLVTLERAINTIVMRHEILRTNFQHLDEELIQQVHEQRHLDIRVLDLSNAFQPDEVALTLMAREMVRPFNLVNGTLLRVSFLRLGPQDYIFHVVMHHIISDGWSMNVMINELATLYNAYLEGRTDPLPPLKIQYADYAHWQTQWLNDKMLDAQKIYWQHQLNASPDFLLLPALRPHLPVQSFRGSRLYFSLNPQVSAGLKQLGPQAGCTLFMVLESAFAAFLYRYSGQSDILLGTPVANRNRQVLEPMIGFFVNTLVLRHRVDGRMSFLEFLAEARKISVDAFANQDIPFEQVVEVLKPTRSLSFNTLFQVIFVLQDSSHQKYWLRGLQSTPESLQSDSAKFDLTMAMSDNGTNLDWSLEYNSDLFDATMIENMADLITYFLSELTHDPNATLDALALCDPRALLADTKAPKVAVTASLTAQLDLVAQRQPEAVAISLCGRNEQQITYASLFTLADQIRAALVQCEAKLVAIDSAPSGAAIAAVLGALKSGTPYLLMPALLKPMQRDELARSLRVDTLVGNTFPTSLAFNLIDTTGHIRSVATNNLDRSDMPRCAAVFLGSSLDRLPKAALISEDALLAQTTWFGQLCKLAESSVVLQGHALFDEVGQIALLATLAAGARMIICPDGEAALAPISPRVTALCCTPSTFHRMRSHALLEHVPDLVHVMLSGEASDYSQTRPWLAAHPSVALWHGLSLPELCGPASYLRIDGHIPLATPVGQVSGAHRAVLVDAMSRPVPKGVAGELLLSGPGLALGYHLQPELSAARFSTLPLDPQTRWFRTGQWARQLSNGDIKLLGVCDTQSGEPVSNISLADVEAALFQHPGVTLAAARFHEDSEGQRKLVGYYCGDCASPLQPELSLPSYLCPAVLVQLKEFPYTLKGKIDRQALPLPSFSKEKRAFAPPRTPSEELLALIWAEVLDVKQVDIFDNFFDLGGQSLMATRVASRVRETLKVELPLKNLFLKPTIAGLAQVIDELGGRGEADHVDAIEPCSRKEPLPLSFAQKRLWFIHQLNPSGNAYNLPLFFRLAGPLHVPVLQRCLNALVERHETLRTLFVEVDGNPAQKTMAFREIPLQVVALAKGARLAGQLRQLITHAGQEAFHLEKGPLFRALLIRQDTDEHILFLNQHHIISDGWSINILIVELSRLYRAFLAGQPSPLPPLAIQYPDYAAWQNRYADGAAFKAARTYWMTRLEDAPRYLELPIQYPRPAVQTFEGAVVHLTFDASLGERLHAFGRRRGATLFMTLLGGFASLLARYSNQRDLVIGSPSANRGRKEIEPLLGFFVNTLVYRLQLAQNTTVADLIALARTESVEAFTHQEFPFEKLVEQLQPERNLGRSPLFQVLFALQNATDQSLDLPALKVEPLKSDLPVAKFDLTLNAIERDGVISLSFVYNRALFRPAFMERMAARYRILIEAMLENPEVPVLRLAIMDEAEQYTLLETWNQTQQSYPAKLLHQGFIARAKAHPSQIAAYQGQDSIGYGELHDRAETLARYLAERGVGPESLVGIYARRGIPMLTGILGILMAGGAYLPLDPNYPSARLAFMIEDAAVNILVCESAELIPPTDLVDILLLDQVPEPSAPTPLRVPDPINTAYVLYTSGSTGKPKGAMLSHRAVCNQLRALIPLIQFKHGDRLLQKTPISFDASIWEIFLPLWEEADLVLADMDAHADPMRLAELIRDEGITHVQVVPSFLESLLAEPIFRENRTLKQLFCGGEAFSREALLRFKEGSQAQVINFYGPTEAAINASYYACQEPGEDLIMPIGKPMGNCQIFILSHTYDPVPVDIPGELCIGGAQLARGYLRRPALTAAKFTPDPFSHTPGARLYRSGDLAIFKTDGQISFKGRIDHQVKLRGLRIETDEIESLIREVDHVETVAVIVREDGPGNAMLVAYIVTQANEANLLPCLTAHLMARLPRFMVPTSFILLERLPTTPNGKLDRKALPAPDIAKHRKAFVAPGTELETQLAAIWKDVLGLEEVSMEDNFFEIGGHSLLVAKVIARIRENLEIELPMKFLFEQPTLAGIARRIQSICDILPGLMEASEPSDSREEVAI